MARFALILTAKTGSAAQVLRERYELLKARLEKSEDFSTIEGLDWNPQKSRLILRSKDIRLGGRLLAWDLSKTAREHWVPALIEGIEDQTDVQTKIIGWR